MSHLNWHRMPPCRSPAQAPATTTLCHRPAMNEALTSDAIAARLAKATIRRIVMSTIRSLQRTNSGLSGENCLRSLWDEICVQVQHQHSIYWATYELTLRSMVEAAVGELPDYVRGAIWLQTEAGWEWERDPDDNQSDISADITQYLLTEHLYPAAEAWSNQAIRRYMKMLNATG